MNTFKFSYLLFLAGLIAVPLLISSCSDDTTGPDIDSPTNNPPVVPHGEPIDPPPSDSFKIDSDDVTETDDGYRFEGNLIGINEDGIEFQIGEGEFDVVLDANGVVISITGIGLPEFPDIGIYKDILEDFAWDKIESHILYRKGSEFLNEFNTDIPLNPDRYYITYRVFDESRDGNFELRGRANNLIHGFNEIYIDPEDPAVFLKFQLWKPKGKQSVAEKFWKRAYENAKTLGKNISEYSGAPNMIVGISNNGTFLTPEYELGLKDSNAFETLYGFTRMESRDANLFLGLKGVPIPKTGVLQLNGHVFIHSPLLASVDGEGNINSVLDWFNEFENAPASSSFAGSMDFGRKGIELILTAILPGVNDFIGRDIFNDDIDIDLITGFMQEYNPNDGSQEGYFRLGGTIQKPLIVDIFGPDYQRFLVSQPDVRDYMYLDVGYDLDNSSLFLEQAQRIIVPYYGEIDLTESYFKIDRDGFNFHARTGFDIGPVELNRELTGQFTSDGYLLSSVLERDITLSNGVVLGNRNMALSLSSDSGALVDGSITLPFSIGEASIQGQVSSDGLSMTGMLSAGSQLALDAGLNLPTRDFELTVSTDPNRILELHGETQMPFLGYNRMTGLIHKDHFFFDGEVDRTISFGNLDVPIGNGKLMIDSKQGLFLNGNIELPHLGSAEMAGEITNQQIRFSHVVNRTLPFSGVSLQMSNGTVILNNQGASLNGSLDLPANLRTASVSGSITQHSMDLKGSMSSSLTFQGVNFSVSNSEVTANTNSGVRAAFRIRLVSNLSVNVSGNISQNGYSFTGSNSFSRSLASGTLSGTISTRLTHNGITLTGTGRVVGLLGNELWNGSLDIRPNWSNGKIEVCTANFGCVDI